MTMTTSYYTHYIVLGGQHDGRTFERTADGLSAAKECDGDYVRPCRPESAGYDRHDRQTFGVGDWDDIEEYGCVIDRGDSAAYIKQ